MWSSESCSSANTLVAPLVRSTAPITVVDMEAPRIDAERLQRLANGHATFMSAASPGVTALFFPNQFYASDEEYVFALAEGLRHEYETIATAGITLQVDCPDLAMSRHTGYQDLSDAEFVKVAEAKTHYKASSTKQPENMSLDQLMSTLVDMEKEMKQAARSLDFEHAAIIRDELARLKKLVPAEQRRKSP